MLLTVLVLAALWLVAIAVVLGTTTRPADIADIVLADTRPVTKPIALAPEDRLAA